MLPRITVSHAAKILGITPQAIHKKIKSLGKQLPKVGQISYIDHDTAKLIFDFHFSHQVIGVHVVKGGTGKTTICSQIAACAAIYGAKVLAIDTDQQGNLTQSLNINNDVLQDHPILIDILDQNIDIQKSILKTSITGLDVIPSRLNNAHLDSLLMMKGWPLERVYKRLLDPLKQQYDLILVDCPPALGLSVTATTLAVDTILSPTNPDKFPMTGLDIAMDQLQQIEDKFGYAPEMKVVLNKFDARTKLSSDTLTKLVGNPQYNKKLLPAYIRINQEFANAISDGKTIFDSTKPSLGKEDIELITSELLGINLEPKNA